MADELARIGLFADNIKDIHISKNLRIAIGLTIVKHIVAEVEKFIMVEGKRKTPITVYIKA